ncbi:MAG: phosphomethylpyrimidine synthase ThiC [Phycisphaerales bacterium]
MSDRLSPAEKAAELTTRSLRTRAELTARFRTAETAPAYPGAEFELPVHGAFDPGVGEATTPGSFALAADVGGALMFASPDTPGMPGPSDKTAWDFLPEGWRVEIITDARRAEERARSVSDGGGVPDGPGADASGSHGSVVFTDARGLTRRVTYPEGFVAITQLERARLGEVTAEMRRVAEREPHLSAEQIRDEIAAGRMIIPANVHHLAKNLDPMCIGRASKTKVNANMGASPVSSGTDEEVEKLKWAERWGGDTVMDLSTGGDLDACRQAIIDAAAVPIGTVPIYSMIIGRKLEDLDRGVILSTIEHQARQGVDYMTVHAGVKRAHLPLVKKRLIGIVSRGGSLLAKWMLVHNAENPMYDLWDEICEILRAHDVSFSIGDGLRPGGLADATDAARLRNSRRSVS